MKNTNFLLDGFRDSDCYNSFTAMELDGKEFVSRFSEEQLQEFKAKLENAGFVFAGTTDWNTMIFSFPTTLRDFLREEIETILEEEIFS